MPSILAETLAPRETGSDCRVLSRALSAVIGRTRRKISAPAAGSKTEEESADQGGQWRGWHSNPGRTAMS